jgi:hypothetical protein
MRTVKRFFLFVSIIGAVLLLLGLPFVKADGERVRFGPKFSAGEIFYYRIESRSTTTGKTTTPIENPEGVSQLSQTISLLVRLDVVGVSKGPVGASQVRFRATFNKASARSESDAFNPDTPPLEDQYGSIEGQSIEFTLKPNGELIDLNGLSGVFPNLSETDPVLSWAQALATGGRFPREGVVIGQKWTNERALEGALLSGLLWRTESTYSRDDVCGYTGEARGQRSLAGASDCAIILTHFEILRRGSNQPDATPEEYRKNGLRTSGTWTGSGESLETISLATGYLESSTQTSTQNMDYQIQSASTGSRIHRVGKVYGQSEIRRVFDVE